MKICIIAGSLPPEACGVGDFTAALASGLRARGVEVVLLHRTSWGLAAVGDIISRVRHERPDIVHLEYPTHGFKNSLAPHLLHVALSAWPRVTTLHGYLDQQWVKTLSMSAFAIGGRVILLGPEDMHAYRRNHPWMRSRTSVIPIGSNIPGGEWAPEGNFSIVHFGMLRPNKGIEDFLQLARLCHEQGRPYRLKFIGAVLPHGKAYADTIFNAARDLPIEWRLDVPPEEVSQLLRTSHVAYLPPPSGVHERRGTLLAAALNGVPIVAKVGRETPDTVRPHVLAADNAQQALEIIDGLQDPARLAQQSARSRSLSQMFSWDFIISQYIRLFNDMCAPADGARVAVDGRPAR